MNIFSDVHNDYRVTLFISELEQLALDDINTPNSKQFKPTLFPFNWVLNKEKYTKGMKNQGYTERPKFREKKLNNLFSPHTNPIFQLIPDIDNESMNPQFLSYIIIVCSHFNNTDKPLILATGNTKFDKLKNALQVLKQDADDLDTVIFVRKLLDKLKIEFAGNDGTFCNFVSYYDKLDNIEQITIPSFYDLVFNITNTAPYGRKYPKNDVVLTDKTQLLDELKSYDINDNYFITLTDTLKNNAIAAFNAAPGPLTQANYQKTLDDSITADPDSFKIASSPHTVRGITTKFDINLYDIPPNKIVLIHMLMYIFNINSIDMAKIITNFSNHELYKIEKPFDDNILKRLQLIFVIFKNDMLINNLIRIILDKINSENKDYIYISTLFNMDSKPINITLPIGGFDYNITLPNTGVSVDPAVKDKCMYINIWELILHNLDTIIFHKRPIFSWHTHQFIEGLIKESYKTPVNIDIKRDTWFDNEDDDGYPIEYVRNESGELCKLQNGDCISIKVGSELYNEILKKQSPLEKFGLIGTTKENEDDPLILDFIIKCIVNDDNNITRDCISVFNNKNFFEKARTEITNILPLDAIRVLEKLEIPKETKNIINNKTQISVIRYKSYDSWLNEIVKAKVTEDEFKNILNNNKLQYYITGLIKKINNNLSILNRNYKPNLNNVTFNKKKESSLLARFFSDLMKIKLELLTFLTLDSRSRFIDGGAQAGGFGVMRFNHLFTSRPPTSPDLTNYEKQLIFNNKHFVYSYIELEKMFTRIEKNLLRYNKTIAPETKSKIYELINSVKRSEEKSIKALGVLEKLLNILKTPLASSSQYEEKEITLAQAKQHAQKYINATATKLEPINSIFATLMNNIDDDNGDEDGTPYEKKIDLTSL